MSLLPVFSQVLTLDAEVSDNALNNIRKSTNEILEEMKKIEQGASAGINRFFAFVQEIAASFNELSLVPEIYKKSLKRHLVVLKNLILFCKIS